MTRRTEVTAKRAADVDIAFGRYLSELRATCGLTQSALSKRAGLHRTYVSQLERGLKSPTLTTLHKIASVLGIKPSHLVRGCEN